MTSQEKNLIKESVKKCIENKNCDKTTKMVGLSILDKIKNERKI